MAAHGTDADLVIPVTAPNIANEIDIQVSSNLATVTEGQSIEVTLQAVNRTTRAPKTVEGSDVTVDIAYAGSAVAGSDVAGDVLSGTIPIGQSQATYTMAFSNPATGTTLPASFELQISNPAGGSGHVDAPQIDANADDISVSLSAAASGGVSYMDIVDESSNPLAANSFPRTPHVDMWATAYPAYNPPVSVELWGNGQIKTGEDYRAEAIRIHPTAKDYVYDDANSRVIMYWWEGDTPESSTYKTKAPV